VPIGYRKNGRPIYPILGASKDGDVEVEPDNDEDGEDGAEDDDEQDGDDSKYKPPSRAEWLKVQNALLKANSSAKQRREALAERERQIADLQAAVAKREAEDERRALESGRKAKKGAATPAAAALPDDVLTKAQVRQMTAEAVKAAIAEVSSKNQSKIAGVAARAALIEAGSPKSGASRLINMLDLDAIEIDDDGEVIGGLDDQVEGLKAEFPQLFVTDTGKKTPKRTPVTRAAAAGRQDPAPEFKSTAERMAAQIMGGR